MLPVTRGRPSFYLLGMTSNRRTSTLSVSQQTALQCCSNLAFACEQGRQLHDPSTPPPPAHRGARGRGGEGLWDPVPPGPRGPAPNGWSLLLTAVLGMIIVYLFTLVAFVLFRDDFVDNSGARYCENLVEVRPGRQGRDGGGGCTEGGGENQGRIG